MRALLQLDSYWIEELHVKARPEIPDKRPLFDARLPRVSCEILHALEEEQVYRVDLRLVAGPKTAASTLPYEYRLKMTGIFSFPPGTPAEKRERLIHISGPAMLYGFARAVIAQATALGPHGEYILPSLNFVALMERKGTQD